MPGMFSSFRAANVTGEGVRRQLAVVSPVIETYCK
jgi:hypothetical protein